MVVWELMAESLTGSPNPSLAMIASALWHAPQALVAGPVITSVGIVPMFLAVEKSVFESTPGIDLA